VEEAEDTRLLQEVEERLRPRRQRRGRLSFLPAESECLQAQWNELIFTLTALKKQIMLKKSKLKRQQSIIMLPFT